MAWVSSKFSWDDITIGPNDHSQYRILDQFLQTTNRRFYNATHPEFGDNIVIKQFPPEKLLDIVSAIRYLYIFNGMTHSIHVYDMWNNSIAMERLEGMMDEVIETFITKDDNEGDLSSDEIDFRDATAFDCFFQLLRAVREFHYNKVALFNISPKTVGWVLNKDGFRIYKFFDYTTARSFSLVKRNPIEDVIAIGHIFINCKNHYIQTIARDCVSGKFGSEQMVKKALETVSSSIDFST